MVRSRAIEGAACVLWAAMHGVSNHAAAGVAAKPTSPFETRPCGTLLRVRSKRDAPYTAASAASTSSQMSSVCSRPQEIRMKPSEMPKAARWSGFRR
jgi:hypothetical protein